jgi:hypothetical protein
MTDFLDNLVNRTLQPSAVVRPRLPSLFEPSSLAASQAPANQEEGPNPVPVSSVHRPMSLVMPRVHEPAKLVNFGPSGSAIPQANQVTGSAPQIVTQLASRRITPEASSIRSLSSEAAPGSRTKNDSDPRDLIETLAMRARASHVADSAMLRDRAKLRTADESTQFHASEAAPTISVTIGRVDVRAVYPQPQAPPARRVQPAPMSLDEYFKKRREGHK